MGRARAILQSEFPYNIGARSINKEWFSIPLPVVWDIFCEELTRTSLDHGLAIHSFVLMSNHYHMIASTPEANISQCMHQFMTRTSRRLTKEGNRINESFAGRHFKCILHQPNFYLSAYKYNYRNPIAAHICDLAEDYPFSSLQLKLRKESSKIPLIDDLTLHSDPEGTLKWINTPPNPQKLEGFSYGLKRPYFKSKKNPNGNHSLFLENDVL